MLERLIMTDVPGLTARVYRNLSYRQRKAGLLTGLVVGGAIAAYEIRRDKRGDTGTASEEANRFVKLCAANMALGRWVVPAVVGKLVRP
jgi:hypothetical protein